MRRSYHAVQYDDTEQHESILGISEQLLRICYNCLNGMSKYARHSERPLPRPACTRTENIKGNILVVDDDLDITHILANLLVEQGFTIVSRTNGLDALHCFYYGTFDLVITDICMPGINGNILARHIKNISNSVPVVALTSSSALAGDHFDQIIKKPFQCDELLCAVEKLLQLPAVSMKSMHSLKDNSENPSDLR